MAEVKAATLADELVRIAEALEPLNGGERSAAVWSLDGGARLLYSGPHASADIVEAATRRLRHGDPGFEIEGRPGVRGRVVCCGAPGDMAAYGLFVHGGGQPHLASTIDQLVDAAERSIGKPVEEMNRTQKQHVVRFLDERGAFLIRKAVEDVADRLGVTRFTIYNYLEQR
jgi:hypothetical protein